MEKALDTHRILHLCCTRTIHVHLASICEGNLQDFPGVPAVVQVVEIVQEILPYTALVQAQEIWVCPEKGQSYDIYLTCALS